MLQTGTRLLSNPLLRAQSPSSHTRSFWIQGVSKEDMSIKVYYTSVSSNQVIKKAQLRIFSILEGKKIDHECLDIAADDTLKAKMRELAGDPKALPPIICNRDDFCGDFEAFEYAIEMEQLNEFLKL